MRDVAPTSLLVGTMKSSLRGILRSVCSEAISVAYVVGDERRVKSVVCLTNVCQFKRHLELCYGP